MKTSLKALLFSLFTAATISLAISPARADGDVPPDVTSAVKSTTATVQALSPIALAAISVALVPFGAGMALSFIHKVMSKA